jgi:5-aminopentanamidase
MSDLSLALWQRAPAPWSAQEFLCALEAAVAKSGAHVFVTNELCWPGYGDAQKSMAEAVTRDSPLIVSVQAIAARQSKAIVLGYAEKDGAHVFNSAICIGSNGVILANYRKQTAANDYESSCFARGGCGSVFLLNGIPTSILICMDVEFPELVRRASLDGAQLLIVPTALAPKWRVIPEAVIPARAYENGIFIAYCNYAGEDDIGQFCGQSLVAGPDGRAIVSAGSDSCILEATINSDRVTAARSQLDYLQHLEQLHCHPRPTTPKGRTILVGG